MHSHTTPGDVDLFELEHRRRRRIDLDGHLTRGSIESVASGVAVHDVTDRMAFDEPFEHLEVVVAGTLGPGPDLVPGFMGQHELCLGEDVAPTWMRPPRSGG